MRLEGTEDNVVEWKRGGVGKIKGGKGSAYLLDDWQHPGLCVLISVGTDTLSKKKSMVSNDNMKGYARSREINLQDQPCWGSRRPCKRVQDQREGLQVLEARLRQGNL